ncbi:DUF1097 domain-containing protein [Mycolicibacterium elephantis]|uniref:DUF1097 domain-containing protein n=1 Tax=Mycolicibacterium elephantis TaxID=81858 RepID=A0A0M2ZPV2_9MYCO|nr:DUF1097 domain-containing protein [Mycolicibacterium elephantis]KKW66260.1 membrane protein [Mycolicibacterium elephantis]OBA83052.1 hypothetical protein A5633_14910 [Mycolicibacterium elephantis]OBB23353.1 hypothetical protein A5762_01480 [Mycolicibacterium elephantis]ORA61935.1 hypothetical protein BST23_20655 [Mycolicibacterium elephantis]
MESRTALTLSIGVLGGLAVVVTAEVITVPIWVVFLSWASFFFVGGAVAGWVRSLSCNLAGVLIASASLYAAELMGGGLWVTALAVGVGSAVMVAASRVPLLSTTPAVVVGFASTVSTVAGTGNAITVTSVSHPGLVAATACVLGASFGLLSEYVANVLTGEAATEGSPA